MALAAVGVAHDFHSLRTFAIDTSRLDGLLGAIRFAGAAKNAFLIKTSDLKHF